MTNPRFSRLATDLLVEEPSAHVGPSADDDARAILAIEVAIRSSARRRRVRRAALAGALAIAASVALVVGGRLLSARSPVEAVRAVPVPATTTLAFAHANALNEGVVLLRGGRSIALSDDVGLESSDRVVTSKAGGVVITLSTGTRLVADRSSDLTIAEQGPTTVFALAAGSVHADVAKLHTSERFIVRTPDGEVEVRGTSFEVAVVTPSPACGGGTRTRVAVSEGVVVVRSAGVEESVRKGESWPPGCVAAAAESGASPPAASPPAASPPAASPPAASPTVGVARTAPSDPPAAAIGLRPTGLPASTALLPAPREPIAPPASDLAAQNAIFAEASAARRRGDAASAIAAYDRLAGRYPSSPLAENAYVERMRLLGGSDGRRGAEAARAYLARYPHGFARAEANDLVAKAR